MDTTLAQVQEGKFHPLKLDGVSHALQTIDYPHHEIHGGSAFHVGYSVPSIGAMTVPDDTIQLHFTTGDVSPKHAHMEAVATCASAAQFLVFEAPTGGLAEPTGTVNIWNRRRPSANTSMIPVVYYDATLATGGNTLRNTYFGSSGFFTGTGGQFSDRYEWILKPNTTYAFALISTATVSAEIVLNWYELTDKITVS